MTEFVIEVELSDGKMKADEKKVTVTFETESKARSATKLYKVTTQKSELDLMQILTVR
jgi:hypothetical protein